MPNTIHDLGTKLQALALLIHGVPLLDVARTTGISTAQIRRLHVKAVKKGFDPAASPKLKLDYVQDEHRSGRPRLVDDALEQEIYDMVKNPQGGGKTNVETTARQMGLSASTVRRVLKKKALRRKGKVVVGAAAAAAGSPLRGAQQAVDALLCANGMPVPQLSTQSGFTLPDSPDDMH